MCKKENLMKKPESAGAGFCRRKSKEQSCIGLFFTAVLLLLVMSVPAVHVTAATTGEIEDTSGTVTVDSSTLLDNDELLDAYVEQMFTAEETDDESTTTSVQSVLSRITYTEKVLAGADSGILSSYGSEYLTDVNLEIYEELKSAVAKIASGEEASSAVTMSFAYTFTELGATNVYDAAAAFQDQLNFTAILTYLTNDCPYELYWYDKTASSHWMVSYTYSSSRLYPTLTFTFAVAEGYQGDSSTTVDASKVAVAVQAAENAQSIVEKYSDLTDEEKLYAYLDEICDMVSYSDDYDSASYGDIWQLVYVFDDDSTTNVVCEGYAKAFQYLCDLSSFDYAYSFIVDGYMSSSSAYGAHMWNVVCLKGVNYLVDVTNSDSGMIGVNGGLFLVCADDATSSSASGYSFKVNGTAISYSYSSTILSLYSSDDLTLGSVADHTVQIVTQPEDITAEAGDKVTFTISATGDDLSYQWQYSTNSGSTWVNSAWKGNSCQVTVTESKNGYLYRCVVTDAYGNTVTSDEAQLTVSVTLAITSQPEDIQANAGETVTFTIEATGNSISYQWQYSTNGGTTWTNSAWKADSCQVTAAERRNGYLYRCIVTDASGNSIISDEAELSVVTFAITSQPEDITAAVGNTVTFTIKATGSGLTYQWQYSTDGGTAWVNSSWKTTYCEVNAVERRNGYMYRCIVTDADGNSLISDAATLTVSSIVISVQPEDIEATAGDTVTFTITASGNDISYQWQYSIDGGETWYNSAWKTSKCQVTVSAKKNGYLYRCVLTDADGNTRTSDVAELIVVSE